MTSRSKAKGSGAERAVVEHLRANGFVDRILVRSELTEDGCLEFRGATVNGYGYVGIGSRKDGTKRCERVHRLAWMAIHGVIPAGQLICHRCDNRLCFHPDHLFLGTPKENSADMVAKGRQRCAPSRGAANGRTRLNEQAVLEIRQLAESGVSCRQIAKRFDVASGTVSSIVRRINWRWVA